MTPTSPAVDETIPRQPGLALVHFRADGSTTCDRVAAVLELVAQSFVGRLPIAEIDVNDHPELAEQHNVQATPTILLIRDGEVVDRVIGTPTRTLLQSLLDARAPRPVAA